MAYAGTGTLADLGKDSYVSGIETIFYKARIANDTTGTFTNLSNLYTITYETPAVLVTQAILASNIVFSLTAAGTVNKLLLYNAAGTLTGALDLTAVVYATATYYTLSELIFNIT